MTQEQLFSLGSTLAMAGWIALALAPLRRRAAVLTARSLSALVCGLYATLFVHGMLTGPPAPEGAGFGTLAAVEILFSQRAAILVGWIHYLAFDLFIGAWEVEDAERSRVPHWIVLPCLFFTLMRGPIGLLAYLLVKAVRTRMAASA